MQKSGARRDPHCRDPRRQGHNRHSGGHLGLEEVPYRPPWVGPIKDTDECNSDRSSGTGESYR